MKGIKEMLNSRTLIATCPKTGEIKSFCSEYPEPNSSLNDKISKKDLPCGENCKYEPCPIVEKHNSIY